MLKSPTVLFLFGLILIAGSFYPEIKQPLSSSVQAGLNPTALFQKFRSLTGRNKKQVEKKIATNQDKTPSSKASAPLIRSARGSGLYDQATTLDTFEISKQPHAPVEIFSSSEITFKKGTTELSVESSKLLTDLAKYLKRSDFDSITIEGHLNDPSQLPEINKKASFEKANAIRFFLTNNLRLPHSKFHTLGLGEQELSPSKDTRKLSSAGSSTAKEQEFVFTINRSDHSLF